MAIAASRDNQTTSPPKPGIETLQALVSADLRLVNEEILRRMDSHVAMIPQVARHIIAAGGKGDPFLKGKAYEYEPVPVAKTIKDGEKVTLGGWTLTAHITGGHTAGCTTWTFPVTVAGKVRQGLVHCSSSVLSGYKLGKTETYPGITAAFEKSFATWKALPCEVFLGSHGRFFAMPAKAKALEAGKADAFVDPAGCKAFYAGQEAAFRAELKKQNP